MDFPTLTANLLIFRIQNHVPKMENKHTLADEDRKLKDHEKLNVIKNGDVLLIKGHNKNRCKWNIVIVPDIHPGIDGKVRAVKL